MHHHLTLLLLLTTLSTHAAVYRWIDTEGRPHFGDQPPVGSQPQQLKEYEQGSRFYRVARVLDGDTIELADGRRVRLIGINAPEIAHHNRPAEAGGDGAHTLLKKLIDSDKVRLLLDRERHDRYERLLAHLFNEEGTNLNQQMVSKGAAYVVARPPNLKHIDSYLAAEQKAREAKLGIWQLDQFQITPASRARELRNSFRRLRTRLLGVERRKKYSELQLEGPLTLLVENSLLSESAKSPKLQRLLKGSPFVLRGWIGTRKGKPLIRLNHLSQLE